jgi:hypothetical protein
MLHGDDAYELRVKLLKQVPEEYPYKDDEWLNKTGTNLACIFVMIFWFLLPVSFRYFVLIFNATDSCFVFRDIFWI